MLSMVRRVIYYLLGNDFVFLRQTGLTSSMIFYWDILPLLVGSLINFGIGGYALSKGYEKTAKTFGWMCLALGFWSLCYAISFMSTDVSDKVFWTSIKYLGATVGPALWAVLAFQLTRQSRWLNGPVRILIGSWVIAILLVVVTNPIHGEFWRSFSIVEGYIEAKTVHGDLFRLYTLPLYAIIVVSSVMYLDFYRRSPGHFHQRAILFVLAALTPVVADILQQADYKLLAQVDQVPMSLLLSSLLFGIAIFRYQALEILPIARDLVVQNIHAGIVVIDANERILEINPFARQLTLHPNPLSQTVTDVFPGLDEVQLEDESEQEIRINTHDGERYFLLKVSAVKEEEVIGFVLVGLDITDRKRVQLELERQATTDPLTGASNRRAFFDLAEMERSRAKRANEPVAILMIDIDYFKKINDTQGHHAGDLVLIELVARVTHTLRDTDIFARYGGEEFVCLIAGDKTAILHTAERLRKAFEGKPVNAEGEDISITISIGAAFASSVDEPLLAVIARADEALYTSKENGRNQVTLFE